MKTLSSSLLLFLLAFTAATRAADAPALGWPAISRDNKPWTRWWWPGSGVDKASLTQQLEKFAAAGIGGVEITPIYGAKGYESRYIDFLSPKWMEMLEHVGREAKRLGLGVDMATGTGWPFGGPWIDEANALQRAVLKDGKIVGEPTKMMVKRAAPGDEGLVVDPFSPDALRRYLAPFEKPFATFPRELVRGQFHDSFEYYFASWTPKFAEVFQQMHGYDVQKYAADLLAAPGAATTLDAETLRRAKSDFRETLARLHLDYLRTWVEWSHERGFIVRNQSHGAPGNVLDLYANADIAETEIFGSTPFPIPGLRRADDEVRHDQDLPEALVIRTASSAGHVIGHNLSSSESCTWLRDHWKVSLAYTKPEIDRLFTNGINHVFYHGTVFSPQDAKWPGWLFYASTQFNPNNTWWDDFSALNAYVGRVQSILQGGKPDNDILIYWPIADIWDSPTDPLMKQLGVHDVKWLLDQPAGKIARTLMDRGYSFDYISDTQLQQTKVEAGALVTPGSRYKVIVVPATRRMPVATIQQLALLAQAGAKVVFEKLPEDVPGLGNLERRRAEFKTALARINTASVHGDVVAALMQHGASREAIADSGVTFIRRATAAGHDYFFSNLTAKKQDGWVQLGVTAGSAAILDPLTGRSGLATLRNGAGDRTEIYLQLAPGESLVLRTQRARVSSGARWANVENAGAPVALAGPWKIEFLKGGPELPPALATTELKSWTDLGGVEAKRFGGTARYRLEFDAPTAKADDWLLDLGDVRESARVRLNGRDVATAWSIPFQIRIGAFLKPGRNVLELEVTNLAANRIRDMDGANDPARKVEWKIMREINFVNINYQPFDASKWAIMPSGLLGPLTLTPLTALKL
jgi:alpha-L-rhamnosidase